MFLILKGCRPLLVPNTSFFAKYKYGKVIMKLFRYKSTTSSSAGASGDRDKGVFSISTAAETTTIGNKDTMQSKDKLRTHIEVCARIRPLQISKSRDGYFSNSPARRKVAKPHRPSPSKSQEEFVAWDVNGDGDTAAQSCKTELIQGRTHSYTLDKVYGTQASTKDIYDRSIRSLVNSSMEVRSVLFSVLWATK